MPHNMPGIQERMDFNYQISRELKREIALGETIKALLKPLPKGKLRAKTSRGRSYYTLILPSGERYIGRVNDSDESGQGKDQGDLTIVNNLKTRHFLEEMWSRIKSNVRILKRVESQLLDYDPNSLMDSIKGAYSKTPREIIHKLGFPDYSEFGKSSSFRDQSKLHSTGSGLKVRSRAELAIAELYRGKGLEVVYETELHLPGGAIVHPDFTIYVKSKGKYVYHEHLGMLDDEAYVDAWLRKFRQYIMAGIYPNRDLLMTCDEADGSLDLEKLERIVDDFLR